MEEKGETQNNNNKNKNLRFLSLYNKYNFFFNLETFFKNSKYWGNVNDYVLYTHVMMSKVLQQEIYISHRKEEGFVLK